MSCKRHLEDRELSSVSRPLISPR